MNKFDFPIAATLALAVIGLGGGASNASSAVRESPRLRPTQLSKTIDNIAANAEFSGVVLLGKGEHVMFAKAYGQADKSHKVANNIETRFCLASLGKVFTATLIAQLVERKAIAFSDTVDKYLDAEWISPEIARKVTIAQLLSHTSGLGNYRQAEAVKSNPKAFVTISSYKSVTSADTLKFEPGTKWAYSNSGYLLLGAIIEKVTGRTYDAALATSITQPLGMNATSLSAADAVISNTAENYIRTKDGIAIDGIGPPAIAGEWRQTTFLLGYRGTSAGGAYSTAGDLFKFARGLMDGRLVTSDTFKTLTSPKPASPRYGYGFEVGTDQTSFVGRLPGSTGHGGGAPGVSTALHIFPKGDYVLIILSNYSDDVWPIENKVFMSLFPDIPFEDKPPE